MAFPIALSCSVALGHQRVLSTPVRPALPSLSLRRVTEGTSVLLACRLLRPDAVPKQGERMPCDFLRAKLA